MPIISKSAKKLAMKHSTLVPVSVFALATGLCAEETGEIKFIKESDGKVVREGETLKIVQESNQAIIEFDSFDLETDVEFVAPEGASTLIRVTGGRPTVIRGKLKIPKGSTLWLINPKGVIVAPEAQIDGNGLIMSTLDLPDVSAQRNGATAEEGVKSKAIPQLQN